MLETIILLESRLSSLFQRGRPSFRHWEFFASGKFHRGTGDLCGASEATICGIVNLLQGHLSGLYIKFSETAVQVNFKVQFYDFPGISGRIDGCWVTNIVAGWKGITHNWRIFSILHCVLCFIEGNMVDFFVTVDNKHNIPVHYNNKYNIIII